MSEEPRALPPELAQARERFLELVADLRPELHRYSARLVGSVVDGEDIVQEALAKAFYAIGLASELPPLRPWLFRIAHNTAIDFLRRYEQKYVEPHPDLDERGHADEPFDPELVRASLSSFLALPILQRSAVILKDVLGHSLEETADTMATSVPAVKAALVRGRGTLRARHAAPPAPSRGTALHPLERRRLERYVSLFNDHDWDALRALIAEECRLDLVSKAARRGKEVRDYFARYAAAPPLRVVAGHVEGKPAVLVFDTSTDGTARAAYFILLEWQADQLSLIRDYRYASYVTRDAELEPLPA